MSGVTPFEAVADAYDAWYDTVLGAAVLRAEVACLRPLIRDASPAVEVGAGTGRFTEALAIDCGVEPAAAMLAVAARRGVAMVRGTGEALPVRSGAAGRVALVTAIEFVADPVRVCAEAARALRDGGRLVVGFMPADGDWAGRYRREGEAGDPVFAAARFFTPDELARVAAAAGLAPGEARSTLFDPPTRPPAAHVRAGADGRAGFCAMSFAAANR